MVSTRCYQVLQQYNVLSRATTIAVAMGMAICPTKVNIRTATASAGTTGSSGTNPRNRRGLREYTNS
eukprot:2042173-Rhodomonas_salina.2